MVRLNLVSTLAPAWEADKRPLYGVLLLDQWRRRVARPGGAFLYVGCGAAIPPCIIPSYECFVTPGALQGSKRETKLQAGSSASNMEAVPRRN